MMWAPVKVDRNRGASLAVPHEISLIHIPFITAQAPPFSVRRHLSKHCYGLGRSFPRIVQF
jgi:hypothetical protein